MMKRRILTAAMATCLSVLTVQPIWAAPVGAWPFANEKAPKTKTISFHIRNDSKSALTLSTGDQQYTVQPGRVIDLKLHEGTQVTAVNGTGHVAAGAIVTTVTSDLQGNTLAIS